MDIDLSFDMLPAQRVAHEALLQGKRFVLLLGGIGAGKSYFGARWAWRFILERGGLGWIVSPTYKVSKAPQQMFEAMCPHPSFLERAHYNKLDRVYANLINNATVEIRTAERPQYLSGANLSWCWVDEAKDIDKDAWIELRGRMRMGGVMLITTTPSTFKHWLYSEFYRMVEENPDMYFAVKAPTSENRYLQRSEVEDLKRAYRGKWARQYLDAEFANYTGLVYDVFDYDKNVIREPFPPEDFKKDVEWGEGVDFGWAAPCVVVIRTKKEEMVDGQKKPVYNYWHEIYEKKMPIPSLARAIKDMETKFGAHSVVRTSPTDDQRLRINLLRELRDWDAHLGNRNVADLREKGSVNTGIRMVYNLMAEKRLKVHEGMSNTLQEISSFTHMQTKDGEGTDKVIDKYNDALDAIRYDVQTSEKKEIQKQRHITYKIPTQRIYI